ncbi:hypothetical protein H632_c587p0, partial [Helicosporidium sp. ATCC 50920]
LDRAEALTVDQSQGRDVEVAFVSLAAALGGAGNQGAAGEERRPSSGALSVLEDRRRLNVALTRARSKLVVLGDPRRMRDTQALQTALEEMDTKGAFVRKDAVHRHWIKKGSRFEPEADRYHLYVSLACPWASRCVAALYLKGLDKAVGLSVVHPTWQRTRPDDENDAHTGWAFASPDDPPKKSTTGFNSIDCEGCIPDPINHAKFVRDLYELANDTGGKYSVPVLWDKKEKTIVNNESSDILRMFNRDVCHVAHEINEWVYPNINNGVYKCGFAQTQEAYDEAFESLFEALDKVENILSSNRYLTGSQLTEADIRLFVTLIRFDEIYVVYFKTNKQRIQDYPHISNYVRELYQMEPIRKSVSVLHCKRHYYTSHPRLNYYAIIPRGGEAWWEESHNRDKM